MSSHASCALCEMLMRCAQDVRMAGGAVPASVHADSEALGSGRSTMFGLNGSQCQSHTDNLVCYMRICGVLCERANLVQPELSTCEPNTFNVFELHHIAFHDICFDGTHWLCDSVHANPTHSTSLNCTTLHAMTFVSMAQTGCVNCTTQHASTTIKRIT